MKSKIIDIAKRFDADLVGFAPSDRFSSDDVIFKVYPDTKTVIGLGFRVLRGIYRTIEEGSTFYQYTTMGVENLEETVMPMALLNVSNLIEEEGYEAVPQRKNQIIMNEKFGVNPEVSYKNIVYGVENEPQIDYLNCAVQCGLGERSMIGSLLTPEFGPFVRYCFILTNAEIEPSQLIVPFLCDKCGECVKSCPGHAISETGSLDTWRCAVYYNGANGSKNPFMPPDAYMDFDNRLEIIAGEAQIDVELAKKIIDASYFYPPAKHFYRTCICGRACDRACYIHLEEKGILTKKFKKKFRTGKDWHLDTTQFETLKRDKNWSFSCFDSDDQKKE